MATNTVEGDKGTVEVKPKTATNNILRNATAQDSKDLLDVSERLAGTTGSGGWRQQATKAGFKSAEVAISRLFGNGRREITDEEGVEVIENATKAFVAAISGYVTDEIVLSRIPVGTCCPGFESLSKVDIGLITHGLDRPGLRSAFKSMMEKNGRVKK